MDKEAVARACREAMDAAKTKPGRYGGRYVARKYDRKLGADVYLVLEDDDPAKYARKTSLDIFAQAVPDKVHPIGRARWWLNEDGTVREFER
jgi:hypothetical protein